MIVYHFATTSPERFLVSAMPKDNGIGTFSADNMAQMMLEQTYAPFVVMLGRTMTLSRYNV